MVRELYQRLREYFNNLPEPTEEERQFIRELNAGYFPITSVHRDDLEGQGFDVEKISDDDMQNLAEKMADDYCEQLFWPSMEITAASVPWHGMTSYMHSWNFPRKVLLSRKKEPVIRHGEAGRTGRFTCPRKTIYAIPANLPNGTSVTVPCVGRTPRNTWERKVVNPYRMKTGYGISAHRHTGCRCF